LDQECAVLLPTWLLPSANVLLAACLKQPDECLKGKKISICVSFEISRKWN